MAGRAVRKGALSQGLFTSWMEELSSMFTADTKKKKSPKKLTKRAQQHRDEAASIIEDFCQVYPAARVEPTEDEITELWERCAYFRPNFLAAAISEQLSLRDGEMEWQPRLRALCVLEYCYLEQSKAPRSVGLQVCEEFRGLLEYLAKDVKQCSAKAKQVLHLNSLPPPRVRVAPMAVPRGEEPVPQLSRRVSVDSPPMPAGQQQYKDSEEVAPLCAPTVGDESQEVQSQQQGMYQAETAPPDPAASHKSEDRDADSETTASSGEEDTAKTGNREDSAEDAEEAVPEERFKASTTAVACALQGDDGPVSPGLGASPDAADAEIEDLPVLSELEGLSFDPDKPVVGVQPVCQFAPAPTEWASSSATASSSSSSGCGAHGTGDILCKDLSQAFEAASSERRQCALPSSTEATSRPFLWLASVETAMPDRVTWEDPLASLNPSQLASSKCDVTPMPL
eukprot:gb/GFBE01031685.1/.p1 GENE.gb/GFBE01031685.1/~~gb/GFBE01031685.1/.p1  ORF type:complete len:454 (+),score=104.95 gb/GFBE01031685.1/:1-1362(+)